MQKQITKNTLLSDIISEKPEAAVILMGYGLHCVGCSFSSFDTLEAAIKIHGMNEEEFEMLLKDLNSLD
jgi:hybrid cluster-associated redox disulfide protein